MSMKNRKYVYQYTVTGQFGFPIDMLRYDGSHPRHETDSYEIRRSVVSEGNDNATPITLQTTRVGRDWRPEEGRWKSFGWKVTDVQIVREVT